MRDGTGRSPGGKVLGLLLAALLLAAPTAAEEPSSGDLEFNRREILERRGNLFEMLFGTPPPLASERGLLLVAAYLDRNGNGVWEEEEPVLRDAVTCHLNGVDYGVPAFIPGLEPERVYQLVCGGEGFLPRPAEQEIFFKRRGEIRRVALACTEAETPTTPEPGPASGKDAPGSKR